MKNTLTTRELAEAIGVSESSVKRWADDGLIRAARTAGGHRRIPVREAVRFVRESEAVLVRPEVLGLGEVRRAARAAEAEPGIGDEGRRLYAFLYAGAGQEATGLLVSLYLEGWSVARIVDGPVRRCMERLGRLWRHEEVGIFLEHRAVDLVIRALARLRELLPEPPEKGPLALGGAPSTDPYLLPSMAAALVLQSEGVRATNLGPETPMEVLGLAMEKLSPHLVWLSVSATDDAPGLTGELRGLLDGLSPDGPLVALGGRRADDLDLPPHPRLHRGASMAELSALAKALR